MAESGLRGSRVLKTRDPYKETESLTLEIYVKQKPTFSKELESYRLEFHWNYTWYIIYNLTNSHPTLTQKQTSNLTNSHPKTDFEPILLRNSPLLIATQKKHLALWFHLTISHFGLSFLSFIFYLFWVLFVLQLLCMCNSHFDVVCFVFFGYC